ncbi:hypothetical protein P7K49_039420, partial [Saguinus oedipus]
GGLASSPGVGTVRESSQHMACATRAVAQGLLPGTGSRDSQILTQLTVAAHVSLKTRT